MKTTLAASAVADLLTGATVTACELVYSEHEEGGGYVVLTFGLGLEGIRVYADCPTVYTGDALIWEEGRPVE